MERGLDLGVHLDAVLRRLELAEQDASVVVEDVDRAPFPELL
jgi:hypothetical protein